MKGAASFREVHYITSPGYGDGGYWRETHVCPAAGRAG